MDDERRLQFDPAAFPDRRSGDGRRAHPRVRVSLPVSGTGAHADHEVEATDLSVGGFALVVPERLPPGARASLLLQVPGSDDPVRAEGEIAAAAEPCPGGFRVGVRFLGLDPSDARVIEAFLDRERRPPRPARRP